LVSSLIGQTSKPSEVLLQSKEFEQKEGLAWKRGKA